MQSTPSKDFLLFIVAEPKKGSEGHGVAQRVRAIDAWFSNAPRKIVFVSWRRNWRSKTSSFPGLLSEEHLNTFLHAPRLFRYGVKARFIYAHTCLAAIRAFFLMLFSRKFVLDVHGLLPEELLMMRKKTPGSALHLLAEWIEKACTTRCAALVVVTDAMREHFTTKYPGLKATYFSIPIFSDSPKPSEPVDRDPRLAVYSGGLQEWQCIEETLDLVLARREDISFMLLTGEPQALRKRSAEKGIDQITIKSADKTELATIYARATYGFVLRKPSPVNAVACPTKLVEYLESGVIPIVHEKSIGDFCTAGYRYIIDYDFHHNQLPDENELRLMRQTNCDVIRGLRQKSADGLYQLADMFHIDLKNSCPEKE